MGEYDQDVWLGREVMQSFASSTWECVEIPKMTGAFKHVTGSRLVQVKFKDFTAGKNHWKQHRFDCFDVRCR